MSEQDILVLVLWSVSISYVIKVLVFFVLWLTMRVNKSRKALGKSLEWHYLSLVPNAAISAFTFATLAIISGGHMIMDREQRIWLYVAMTVLSLCVSTSGIVLLVAWIRDRVSA